MNGEHVQNHNHAYMVLNVFKLNKQNKDNFKKENLDKYLKNEISFNKNEIIAISCIILASILERKLSCRVMNGF